MAKSNIGPCLDRIRQILFAQTKLEGDDLENVMIDITRAVGDYGIAEISEIRALMNAHFDREFKR